MPLPETGTQGLNLVLETLSGLATRIDVGRACDTQVWQIHIAKSLIWGFHSTPVLRCEWTKCGPMGVGVWDRSMNCRFCESFVSLTVWACSWLWVVLTVLALL